MKFYKVHYTYRYIDLPELNQFLAKYNQSYPSSIESASVEVNKENESGARFTYYEDMETPLPGTIFKGSLLTA